MTPQSQKDLAALASKQNPIAQIIAEVEDVFGIARGEIIGHGKPTHRVRARQAAMYIAHQEGHSYAAIGRAMKRDHATVMHGVKKAMDRLEAIRSDFVHVGKTRSVYVMPEDFDAIKHLSVVCLVQPVHSYFKNFFMCF